MRSHPELFRLATVNGFFYLVRKELRRWLRRLHDELKITGVFVTHDQEEALEVADRVVVIKSGADRADRQSDGDL